jgi:predicted Zn finger-like uncharacterized protein
MTIDAPCPNCGTIYTVRRDLIGKRTKCTRCGTPFVIAEAPVPPSREAVSPPQEAFTGIPTHLPPLTHTPQSGAPTSVVASTPAREVLDFGSSGSSPRFPAMRIVARSCEITAAIVLLLAVILLLDFFYSLVSPSGILGPSPAVIGIAFFGTLSMALMLLFAAQSIRLGLQIEQNTRETGEACRQLAEHLCGIQVDK